MTAVQRIIRPDRGPFAFPAARAAFNPSHPASAGIVAGHGISVVPIGANFVSLLTGQKGTPTGNTAVVNAQVGPMVALAANNAVSFSGQSTANDTLATVACFILGAAGGGQNYIANGAAGTTGWDIQYTGTQLRVRYGASSYTTVGSAITAGEPYFIAASANGSVCNFIKVRLMTGETISEQISGSIGAVAPDGTYRIGTSGAATSAVTVGPAMLSATFLSKEQLRQWGAAPWGFWYPK